MCTRETRIIRDAKELSSKTREIIASGKTVGLVPTMGYLHAGHASLIRAARAKCDFVVVSDFVNPTQFGPCEDYETYPRDASADLDVCRECGADVLFMPDVGTLYPNGQDSTWVEVSRLGKILCGASRPGHFRGVTTVVSKLIAISRADYAFFGEKDYQQLTILRRMTEDLGFPCEIVGLPIVREHDGLALSSRNVRLAPEARRQAPALRRGLEKARAAFLAGERDASALISCARGEIDMQPDAKIDYISVADADTLEIAQTRAGERSMMLMAVKFGAVRLIDNMKLFV